MNIAAVTAIRKGRKPPHIPCQDAFLVLRTQAFFLAVVADGLGSCPKSQAGAQIVCHAVLRCVKEELKTRDWDSLRNKIAREWETRVFSKQGKLRDYSTTFAFIFVPENGDMIILGRKGDALVALQPGTSQVIFDEESAKEFSNETDALGGMSNSKISILTISHNRNFRFLLATDGVGDELEKDKLARFLDFLQDTYSRQNRKSRNTFLKREILQHFNTRNDDDKTLVFGWSTP
ncbi:MAG: protein phosphatase 2C domain-containing protein [Puniceicoccales bacterium]|nr:protein phosphatase 2C domain-containing protein [Puniceicoccales bacterium]